MINSTLTGDDSGTVYELGPDFMYKYDLPPKRSRRTNSPTATFIHRYSPNILDGTGEFNYRYQLTTGVIADMWSQMYFSGESFTFRGHWGGEYVVELLKPTIDPYRTHWKVSGKMLILCEIEPWNPNILCEE